MKPIIIISNTDSEGKIIISKDEFQKIINETYEQGYNDGKRNGTYIPPQRYGGSLPIPEHYTEITCQNQNKGDTRS